MARQLSHLRWTHNASEFSKSAKKDGWTKGSTLEDVARVSKSDDFSFRFAYDD